MSHPDYVHHKTMALWSHFSASQIADLFAEDGIDITSEQVGSIVQEARRNGDPRAIRKYARAS